MELVVVEIAKRDEVLEFVATARDMHFYVVNLQKSAVVGDALV